MKCGYFGDEIEYWIDDEFRDIYDVCFICGLKLFFEFFFGVDFVFDDVWLIFRSELVECVVLC